ncbi:Endoplasmic reticulum protein EP58, contains filamin rod domain and KDEL motif [Phaffia rhodozyma]|uniref:Endoplasmic reticulum protein EP58, contains filamin rod domain and KDEL motif n=1 Tax=Phaffia rhodozyma TaxID=264483 RepID=A0A0F7SNH3_PHARH|nr:Endoplasmic reticulum protein EP58, contains filamin rod domain and KDEL motif [Phaffia rhodozyma]
MAFNSRTLGGQNLASLPPRLIFLRFPRRRQLSSFLILSAIIWMFYRSYKINIVRNPSGSTDHLAASTQPGIGEKNSQLPSPTWDPKWIADSGLLISRDLHESTGMDRHPIEVLIESANLKVQQMKENRLTSLEQAVAAYRSKYHKNPPKGFDLWFSAFPSKVTPHLYQAAHDSMLPFLAYKGEVLRERLSRVDVAQTIFSMKLQNGKVTALKGSGLDGERPRDLTDLINPIAHLLPSMEIFFNINDSPFYIASREVIDRTTYYASRGELWPEDDRVRHEEGQVARANSWLSPCKQNARSLQGTTDIILTPHEVKSDAVSDLHRNRSFVADFMKAIDYCESPELLDAHSLFIGSRLAPSVLTPIFSTCKTIWNTDIPAIPTEATKHEVEDVPWEEKTIEKAFWRGLMTGSYADAKVDWRSGQRIRLHHFANPPSNSTEKVSVLELDPKTKKWMPKDHNLVSVAEDLFDIGLVDGPVQCSATDGTCDVIAKEIKFAPRVSWASSVNWHLMYKYVIDVDGNGWSSRFRRTLLYGAVVLKSTVYSEWYSDVVIPWYHYVPLQNSYSDLIDIMTFFKTRPEAAKKIAAAGRQFVKEQWQWEDMQSYMLLLLLEYARVLSDDREQASWHGEGLNGVPSTTWR